MTHALHSPSDTFKIVQVSTALELEACRRIRSQVFVEEQRVPQELEFDDLDSASIHYLAFDGEVAVATARLVPKGSSAKIGRVAVVKEMRGRGVGTILMRRILDDIAHSNFFEAVLDAQTRVVPFYDRLGFVTEGDEFLEAGIPHYRMRKPLA